MEEAIHGLVFLMMVALGHYGVVVIVVLSKMEGSNGGAIICINFYGLYRLDSFEFFRHFLVTIGWLTLFLILGLIPRGSPLLEPSIEVNHVPYGKGHYHDEEWGDS